MTYPPMQPPKMKRFGFLALAVAGIVGLFVGGMVSAVGGSTLAPPAPTPTVTVTQTVEPEPTVDDTVDPTEEPSPAAYQAKKSEWKVNIATRKKQCFGSAGCNVTLKIDPIYTGTRDLPDTGTIEVTFEISGDESGPVVETFTVTGSQVSYTDEVDISTRSSGTKVRAKVTSASYSE